MPTLESGSKFVTEFGIVKVISDDRQVSQCYFPANIRTLSKNFLSTKEKQGKAKLSQQRVSVYLSLDRRRKLMREYNNDNVNQVTTIKAYFGEPTMADLLSKNFERPSRE